jgi:hypothetical protein
MKYNNGGSEFGNYKAWDDDDYLKLNSIFITKKWFEEKKNKMLGRF